MGLWSICLTGMVGLCSMGVWMGLCAPSTRAIGQSLVPAALHLALLKPRESRTLDWSTSWPCEPNIVNGRAGGQLSPPPPMLFPLCPAKKPPPLPRPVGVRGGACVGERAMI